MIIPLVFWRETQIKQNPGFFYFGLKESDSSKKPAAAQKQKLFSLLLSHMTGYEMATGTNPLLNLKKTKGATHRLFFSKQQPQSPEWSDASSDMWLPFKFSRCLDAHAHII